MSPKYQPTKSDKIRFKSGMPGVFVVLRKLANNRLRVRKYPIKAGDLELETFVSDVEVVES